MDTSIHAWCEAWKEIPALTEICEDPSEFFDFDTDFRHFAISFLEYMQVKENVMKAVGNFAGAGQVITHYVKRANALSMPDAVAELGLCYSFVELGMVLCLEAFVTIPFRAEILAAGIAL